jgi:hypothetical protein
MTRVLRGLALALALATTSVADDARWAVLFDVHVVPTEGVAHVLMRLGPHTGVVEWIDFQIDPERHSGFEGDGGIDNTGSRVRWMPPDGGGELRWTFRIDHLRDSARYDARAAKKWVLFRGDDLVPPARVRTREPRFSATTLHVRVPSGWKVVTPYPKRTNGTYVVEHPHRFFSRPTGWILAGELGVLREKIAGTSVTVAGPVGQDVRRQDMLAMLRWTLPTLRKIVGALPPRLLVVSAGDPMWRGGLSGPQSLFVHAARPLITPDASSPLVHEVVHTLMRARAGDDGDWIVEGMAEYYSLQALVRSRTISQRRYERALAIKRRRAQGADKVLVPTSTSEITAKAVMLMVALDKRIREVTAERASLDDVLVRLTKSRRPITTARLRRITEKITRRNFQTFFARIR